MHAKFLHMADCHLGFRQYNLRDRFNDFGRVFFAVIDTAIAERVDFVLLAGDLFHKRAIDALTLNQAVAGLERLQSAGIPCLAVEGNHEHAYVDDYIGWMKFLALRQLIILLDAEFKEVKPQLMPYAAARRFLLSTPCRGCACMVCAILAPGPTGRSRAMPRRWRICPLTAWSTRSL